jgi:hypothetical protein
MLFKKLFKKNLFFIGLSFILFASITYADNVPLSLFPLDHYDQSIATWINSNDPDYDKSLLSFDGQQKHFDIFYNHYFGAQSPWNSSYVNQILHQAAPNDLKTLEQSNINYYSNEGKSDDQIGYGENFRAHTPDWINKISDNINLTQWDNFNYQDKNRAIAIDNLHARVLPTDDVHFYHYTLPGQGYPFDNLQMSSLWVGTPVYIITETMDHAWAYVITPDYIAWVKTNGLARTNNGFVNTWENSAKKHLGALTHQTSLTDNKNQFLATAYVGSVLPADITSSGIKMMVPVSNSNRSAEITYATITTEDAAIMPLEATPHHIANIMTGLIGRPYGWGNMYLYNDCSAETKSLFSPFGIWLPRHSSDQVYAGKMVDMTGSSEEDRLSYLMSNGHRFMTIVYIGGHVVMYIGNYANPNSSDHAAMAMTYQNIWGLSPNPADRRAVIGGAVLFPMLLQYPEDTTLVSLANKKYFQVSYLDETPNFLQKIQVINLKSLMTNE